MSNLKPLLLGDTIDVIAPASRPTHKVFKDSIKRLEAQGFKARFHPDIIQGDSFYAADEELQYKELRRALFAKDSKAVWCVRGGWGSQRFIPRLQKLKKPKHKKIFMGFSDITALHLFLAQDWNWKTYHGSNLSAFGSKQSTKKVKQYLQLLSSPNGEQQFKLKLFLGKAAKKPIEGKLIGGNLSLLNHSIGTSFQAKLSNKILFLEDTGERGYQVDRYFVHMIQAGVLNKKIKAIVLGDFTEALERNGRSHLEIAFHKLYERLQIPIYKGLPCGHGKVNEPLRLNSKSCISTGKSPSFIVQS